MDELRRDLRGALRALTRKPGFTLVVVATLGLGIGANTAIFGLLDQVLLRPLPVAEPERLVLLDAPGPFSGSTHSRSETLTPFSHPMFEHLRDRNQVFSGVLAYCSAPLHVQEGDAGERVAGQLVSGSYFDVLGLRPALGRLFAPNDDRTPGAHPVVVLSHAFWQRRFGADPGVVGRPLRVNGHAMTVVGVAPAGFHGAEVGDPIDAFVPLAMQAQVIPTWSRGLGDWRARWLTVLARLRDGVSLEQARAGIDVAYRQALQEDLAHLQSSSERFREAFAAKRLVLSPGGRGTSGLRDESRRPLLALMGMVGLVLAIACANVANLLLARASTRRKEIALRLALGASRARLVRQLLAESVVLALLGGGSGILLAGLLGRALLAALPYQDAARTLSADPDLRVGLFALLLSLATGLLFGLAPALQATRCDLAPTLKSEAASLLGGTSPFRLRKGLVVAQVALSMLLLIGAGLFTRSLSNLRGLDPGFDAEGLFAFTLDPSLAGYDLAGSRALFRRLRDEIAAEPGVLRVSLAREALMTDSDSSSTVRVEGYVPGEDEDVNPNFNRVAPGFFATLGMPLLAGRDLDDTDTAEAPRVAVVNETFARYFFGPADPVGRRIGLGRRGEPLDITIVGVVRDGKAGSLREQPLRFVYSPYTQEPRLGRMTFYVRSALAPETLAARMRTLVARLDPGLPLVDQTTMRAQIRESLFNERLVAALSAAFGLLATLLAALGLYGVTSHAVAQRTREIGVRVALGAQTRTLLLMVLKDVALLAGLGVALGLPGGYGLGRLVEHELYGLTARDPLTFALAGSVLLATALVAGWIPARRAAGVDPVVALRCE